MLQKKLVAERDCAVIGQALPLLFQFTNTMFYVRFADFFLKATQHKLSSR